MNLRKRYLTDKIILDLENKMVFIGGPRQVGKTTLARDIIGTQFNTTYFNWDYKNDREDILNYRFSPDAELLIFDEIHKYGRWKNYLKGFYDKKRGKYKIIVTGSSRLDIYRKGGDSLQGRYHYYRMHPFSPLEINRSPSAEDIAHILKSGGFPEPWTPSILNASLCVGNLVPPPTVPTSKLGNVIEK